jgi:cyclopropane fatty-acyl-phospholipid synthase-like methyltransferase
MRRHKFLAFLVPALSLVPAAAVLTAQSPKTMQEMHALHTNPDAYIKALEDPARDAYQKPHEVLTALDVKQGEIIADIGAGSGYFALRMARHVGDAGHVYAVDVSPDMTRFLNERIAAAKLLNISTILAKPDDPLLPQPVNRFLIVDVWHHIADQPAYLALIKQHLKPGGDVVMIDFKKEDIPVGPPLDMKISREALIAQMTANGFTLVKEHTFLPYQYFLVFRPVQD